MRRLLGVLLVVAAVIWIRRLVGAGADLESAALALGFTLVVASVTGDLLRRFRLPRLTGYLLFGLLVGPYLANLITETMARQLQAINGVATALIALIAGLTLNLERLGPRLAGIARFTAVIVLVAMLGLFAGVWAGWSWVPIAPEASGLARLAMAAIVAVIVVSFSPTMTAAVIAETGARGRLSDLVLATVVLADLILLVLFSLVLQLARTALGDDGAREVSVIARLAWEIGGAAAFGSLVGALFALYLRYIGREVTLTLLGVCALLSQVGAAQRLEPLVAAVAAGLVVENLAVAQGDALKAAVQRGALPVLVVFFVAVGASLQVETLLAIGSAAVLLAGARLGLIRLGVLAGVRAAGLDPATAGAAWTGLVSQAGITLGLASIVAAEFPGWGERVQALLVALVVVHELIGPVLFRNGLLQAGEIGARAPRPLVVVSNREPYLHDYDAEGRLVCRPATGGVAVALDALMRERGGVWIAHGAGSADRDVVDARDRVWVPPESPSYQLRRLWIEERQFAAYYGGFANEGLWPLCHLVDVRPVFRRDDWIAYRAVNARFAAAIDEELGTLDVPVFIQDYHLALVAQFLRARRPDVRTALFWHIPWPYPDRLQICPWRRELLEGLLANDLLAFQLERDRRNFVIAVEEELGAEIEADGARVRLDGRPTTVVAVPIGVDYDRIRSVAADPALADEQRRLVETFGIGGALLGLGVDRLDYTKGIPERLEALDRVLSLRPELRGRLTFLQIGVPSRSELESYGAIQAEIDRRVAEVNARHGVPGKPPPIRYYKGALTLPSLVALYRLAHFCVVSSLHDGMNLVAKEFVAARDDEDGVLVLSALAGAAQELRDAIIINPYDIDDFAAALVRAIDMGREERRARMRAMRRVVAGRDVFSWASDILEGLESLWTKPLQYAARAPEDAPV
ncbi:MAG TPA: trehalose-6-phosphate synthase [Vicinamibacterales bacterium]|nr:trehalose-6-phosphate synthase [Vicinamibacterales bacterium]